MKFEALSRYYIPLDKPTSQSTSSPPPPKVKLGDYYSDYFGRFFPERQWCLDELKRYDDGRIDEYERLYACPEKYTFYYNQGLEAYERRQGQMQKKANDPVWYTDNYQPSSSISSYNPYGY